MVEPRARDKQIAAVLAGKVGRERDDVLAVFVVGVASRLPAENKGDAGALDVGPFLEGFDKDGLNCSLRYGSKAANIEIPSNDRRLPLDDSSSVVLAHFIGLCRRGSTEPHRTSQK